MLSRESVARQHCFSLLQNIHHYFHKQCINENFQYNSLLPIKKFINQHCKSFTNILSFLIITLVDMENDTNSPVILANASLGMTVLTGNVPALHSWS